MEGAQDAELQRGLSEGCPRASSTQGEERECSQEEERECSQEEEEEEKVKNEALSSPGRSVGKE